MKKLLIVLVLAFGITSQAQERKTKTESAKMERMSAEQKRALQVKKMTLELDLNASQQKEISSLLAEQSTKREAMLADRKANKTAEKKQLTSNERFELKNQMLDNQIAMKERMKKILSNDQFKKWDASRTERHQRANKRLAYHQAKKANRMETNKK
ncbi:hypothetical protein IQ05_00312 [Flavobacterium tiangeerense]|uniref:DUF4890 domain-containing protein n=1 Tax=Flavobacterium tiangeerense TaxID=459471 RepID=A0ABY3FNI3_9FLAO|nr:hypothetical protein [Flavobacterium tiangeerense]TWI03369.1 hypothetical protein IQ05_00312 [Flavobacterium tiangeerense]